MANNMNSLQTTGGSHAEAGEKEPFEDPTAAFVAKSILLRAQSMRTPPIKVNPTLFGRSPYEPIPEEA